EAGDPWALAFSPDGKLLAVGNVLRDPATGQQLRQLEGMRGGVQSLAFSPKGDILAAGGPTGILLWDPATGQVLRGFGEPSGEYPRGGLPRAFSRDGRFLAVTGHRTLHLWDVRAGKEMLAFQGHLDGVLQLALSPDGRTLTSAGDDGTVRQWELATGNELRRF